MRALEPVAGLEQMARNRGLKFRTDGSGLPPFSQKTRKGWGNARELTGGPGRLCQALGLKRETHNGLDLLDLGSPLQVRDDGMRVTRVLVTRRIGIRHAVELPLRFALPGHTCVSGPKNAVGKYIVLGAGPASKLKAFET